MTFPTPHTQKRSSLRYDSKASNRASIGHQTRLHGPPQAPDSVLGRPASPVTRPQPDSRPAHSSTQFSTHDMHRPAFVDRVDFCCHVSDDASPFLQSAFATCSQPADVDDDVHNKWDPS
ncbi:hypothetical protein PIB30_001627 [Stylosanthes scabra]|uniref:Uncharacterized protein n=1 Tax=Stylosanthes scabra TaxID=79078 RepID=A0ABU6S299_9FABA|nr:hypothetical protein [Stylosanthes scabra]